MILLELEYLHAVTTAELRWVSSVVDDLRSGALTWSEADFKDANAEPAGSGMIDT